MEKLRLSCPCLFGLESVLAGEVKRMGGLQVEAQDGKVNFSGGWEMVARANLCLRTAERVLIELGSFEARSFEELFQGVKALPLEEFIGIHRDDHFNGGELIELYHSYARQPAKELLDVLLLHNREDLEGMCALYRVMAIPLFFEEQGFSPLNLSLEHTEDAFGKALTNAVFTLQTDIPLPVSLSLHGSGTVLKNCFLAGRERTVLLRLPVYDGILKHFYPDYKNYSYLPAEDTAIHKSVAVYVDKSQRMPATAATCYTKKEGQFLPCFSVPDELPLFRENHKDRQCFLLADDLLNSDASVQKEYLSELLRALVKTKK